MQSIMHAPARFLVGALFSAFVVLGGVAPAQGADDIEDQLAKAREYESGTQEFQSARLIYQGVLLRESLTVNQRTRALLGAARCAKSEKIFALAKQLWERILADSEMPEEAREYAQDELDEYRRKHGSPDAPDRSEFEQHRRKLQSEARKKAVRLVQLAKDQRRIANYEKALQLIYEALGTDASYVDAHEEHDRILAERPSRATLLETFVRFVQTSELSEYQSLRASIRALHQKGVQALQSGNLKIADELLRDAVHRIDASGFLETGGPRYTETLVGRREELVTYLQQVHERGAKEKLTFRSIPDAPDFAERTASLQGQLFALLARLFRSTDSRESVKFYRFGDGRPTGRLPLLSAQFAEKQAVQQSASQLSRARWAERRIRESIGSLWTNPFDPQVESERRARRRDPRILTRFDNLLAVQHREDVQRRVEALRTAFGAKATPLELEVHVYATVPAGTVGATEKLGLRATGPSDGLTLVQRDMLIGECSQLLSTVDGILPLGTLDVTLRERHATRLEITQRTAEHPMFGDMAPPPMRVTEDLARYGLWLDLYAEDLSETAAGSPRYALAIEAATRMPTHTAIVPRAAAEDMPHTRVPRLGEHTQSVNMEMPHVGTLVVLGLPNPFTPSNARAPELMLLIGVRRVDDQTPDPQPDVDERVVPDPYRQREHELGPLSTEVLDHVIDNAWPALADASVLPRTERVVERNKFLARMLTQMTDLSQEKTEALSVSGGRALASLTVEHQAQLTRAIQHLRDHETDIYRVMVSWGTISNAKWTQWVASKDAREGKSGAFRVKANVATPLSEIDDTDTLLGGKAAKLARATQQIAVRRLQERSIVRDIRVYGEDRPRMVPEIASIHQGVIIEVRPGLELGGVRSVSLRARLALWDHISRLDHPATQSARIEVPVWKQSPTGPVADIQVNEIVGDDDTIVLGLPIPGNPEQRLMIQIHTKTLK